ncbi:hypothetical protein P7C73_g4187, partial [Tremellales sp. Uapishka_1]
MPLEFDISSTPDHSFSSSSTCSSSAPPCTPLESASSRTPPNLTTPPDSSSLQRYTDALKAKMTLGMAAAMAELKDDRGGPERRFDVEYGYDEDPFERYTQLHLPTTDGERDGGGEAFRPGLIQFRRSFKSTGTASTSTSADTPGSAWSVSSFEAMPLKEGEDDWKPSHYSAARRSSEFFASNTASAEPRASIASQATVVIPTRSSSLSQTSPLLSSRQPLLKPRPRSRPYPGKRARQTPGDNQTEEDENGDGRSLSEMMILQAGLRSQKGRGVAGGRF